MGLDTKNKIFFLYTFTIVFVANSQNLVENPSFESFNQCPVAMGNLNKDLNIWNSPTFGSTDYFNACSKAMGVPQNFIGEQASDFGVGYVGFYMYAPNDYREYLQAKLSSTLQKGEKYTLSFYISLAERSDFAIKTFEVRFSEFKVGVKTSKVLSAMHWSKLKGDTSNYFKIDSPKYYNNEREWVLVSQEFVANGTENYLLIGNFQNNKKTKRTKTNQNITKGAYYYVDMVSVSKTADIRSDGLDADFVSYEPNAIHVFENLLFNFDDTGLRVPDQQELKSVVAYLKTNSNMSIKLMGHTDVLGSDDYNRTLSLNRAKSVASYLIKEGISERRIIFEGFGSSKPVATNKTEKGRFQNRRVEFVMLEFED